MSFVIDSSNVNSVFALVSDRLDKQFKALQRQDANHADDAKQELFLKLASKTWEFENENHAIATCRRILFQRFRDSQRNTIEAKVKKNTEARIKKLGLHNENDRIQDVGLDAIPAREDVADCREDIESALSAILEGLKEREQSIFKLKYLEGKSVAEIAETHSIAVSSVTRLLVEIRRYIERRTYTGLFDELKSLHASGARSLKGAKNRKPGYRERENSVTRVRKGKRPNG